MRVCAEEHGLRHKPYIISKVQFLPLILKRAAARNCGSIGAAKPMAYVMPYDAARTTADRTAKYRISRFIIPDIARSDTALRKIKLNFAILIKQT
ncbi:hypothetical protein ACFL6I_03250 [candidate division KSB1 bacterium]